MGALRQRGMTPPFVIEGAMNGPMFLAYWIIIRLPHRRSTESIAEQQVRAPYISSLGVLKPSARLNVTISADRDADHDQNRYLMTPNRA